jgi:hypothetical protein
LPKAFCGFAQKLPPDALGKGSWYQQQHLISAIANVHDFRNHTIFVNEFVVVVVLFLFCYLRRHLLQEEKKTTTNDVSRCCCLKNRKRVPDRAAR